MYIRAGSTRACSPTAVRTPPALASRAGKCDRGAQFERTLAPTNPTRILLVITPPPRLHGRPWAGEVLDLDQLDGFAARTLDHRGARLAKLIRLGQEGDALVAQL